jgi:hypothetical protein
MIGSLQMTWETSVGVESEVAFDEATSTRFLRCSCGIRIVCTDTSFAACKSRPFRRRLTCETKYKDARLCVTGKITSHREKPEVIATEPSQIVQEK